MSRATGLVKFLDTGNIYLGVYKGTSDVFYQRICTPEDCYDRKEKYFAPISYFEELEALEPNWKQPKDCELRPVEIYTDYGGGFFWEGLGNEKLRFVDWNSCPIYYGELDEVDGTPDWAKEFLNKDWESIFCEKPNIENIINSYINNNKTNNNTESNNITLPMDVVQDILTEIKELKKENDELQMFVDALSYSNNCEENNNIELNNKVLNYKQLLKQAVEDFALYGQLINLKPEQRVQNPRYREFTRIFDILDHTWRYQDSALKLINENEEDNKDDNLA